MLGLDLRSPLHLATSAVGAFPGDASRVGRVGQEFQQELLQLDLAGTYPSSNFYLLFTPAVKDNQWRQLTA